MNSELAQQTRRSLAVPPQLLAGSLLAVMAVCWTLWVPEILKFHNQGSKSAHPGIPLLVLVPLIAIPVLFYLHFEKVSLAIASVLSAYPLVAIPFLFLIGAGHSDIAGGLAAFWVASLLLSLTVLLESAIANAVRLGIASLMIGLVVGAFFWTFFFNLVNG